MSPLAAQLSGSDLVILVRGQLLVLTRVSSTQTARAFGCFRSRSSHCDEPQCPCCRSRRFARAGERGQSPGRHGLIVFSSTRTAAGFGEVYAVRPDGSGRRNLTLDGTDEAELVLSRDGKRLAYERAGRGEAGRDAAGGCRRGRRPWLHAPRSGLVARRTSDRLRSPDQRWLLRRLPGCAHGKPVRPWSAGRGFDHANPTWDRTGVYIPTS
jgi:hypothetical protein